MKRPDRSVRQFQPLYSRTPAELTCDRMGCFFPHFDELDILVAPSKGRVEPDSEIAQTLRLLGGARRSMRVYLTYVVRGRTSEGVTHHPNEEDLEVLLNIPGVRTVEVVDSNHPLLHGVLHPQLFLGEVSKFGSIGAWGVASTPIDLPYFNYRLEEEGVRHHFPWATAGEVSVEGCGFAFTARATLRIVFLGSDALSLPGDYALDTNRFSNTPLEVLLRMERSWVLYKRQNP